MFCQFFDKYMKGLEITGHSLGPVGPRFSEGVGLGQGGGQHSELGRGARPASCQEMPKR